MAGIETPAREGGAGRRSEWRHRVAREPDWRHWDGGILERNEQLSAAGKQEGFLFRIILFWFSVLVWVCYRG